MQQRSNDRGDRKRPERAERGDRKRGERNTRGADRGAPKAAPSSRPMPLKSHPDVEMARFVVGVGYDDGLRPGNLVGAIANERSEEHTSELQSRPHLVCRLLLEKKKQKKNRS